MAKNNKYASINFNHIYEKSITTNTHNNPSSSPSSSLSSSSSYSSASYSAVSALNKHGRILVLTRPTPKPISHPTPKSPTQHNPIQQIPDQHRSEPGSDPISLRPLGRTGVGSSFSTSPVVNNEKDKDFPISPCMKPGKFVPPHLRPGFVAKGEVLGSESGRFRENGRPKSGGHERMRRDVGLDMAHGNRPNSSG